MTASAIRYNAPDASLPLQLQEQMQRQQLANLVSGLAQTVPGGSNSNPANVANVTSQLTRKVKTEK